MNKELKRAWVNALRSGDWRQGQRRLHRGDRYCCLGVLCDVSELAGPIGYLDTNVDEQASFIYALPNSPDITTGLGTLPDEIKEHLGLTAEAEYELINMNDSRQMNFKDIADWIETNIEEDDE